MICMRLENIIDFNIIYIFNNLNIKSYLFKLKIYKFFLFSIFIQKL